MSAYGAPSFVDDDPTIPPASPAYYVGVDLGQMQDWTAIAVAEQLHPQGPRTPALYDVRHLDRMRVPYPEVVTAVSQLLWALHKKDTTERYGRIVREPRITLAVDGTGVGVAVVDLFRQADLPGSMTAISIHGGDAVTREGDTARVPKRDLAGVVQVLLQGKRLRIANGLPLAGTLTQELLNFRVKISLTGHDSYGAGADWRSANHDDLVLATAMACWLGEQEPDLSWADGLGAFFADAFGMPR